MSVPLATLRRQSVLVWLHDAMALPPAAPKRPDYLASTPVALTAATVFDVRYGRRMPRMDAREALDWLRHWKSESGAMAALRSALQKTEPSAPVFLWSDDQVLAQLAQRLAQARVVATESMRPPAPAYLPAAPAAVVIVEPPAVSLAALAAPPRPPAPPLLPLLEEVQIEGAEVLPEIEQSLEQVNITIGEIKLAPVSLEPTPSKVPAISLAMTDASASITATLNTL